MKKQNSDQKPKKPWKTKIWDQKPKKHRENQNFGPETKKNIEKTKKIKKTISQNSWIGL